MSRNKVIRNFLESNATHLFFIEDESGETTTHCLPTTAKKVN